MTVDTEVEALARIRVLAQEIADNQQFAKILRKAKPRNRRGVYELISPHVAFRPTPWILMKLRIAN